MKKSLWITIAIVLIIISFAVYIKSRNPAGVSEELVKCIGNNSIVYTQIGCHACESQKQLFGENYQYVNDYICNTNWDYCLQKGIKATPTWEINRQMIEGIQTIEKLKELTGC